MNACIVSDDILKLTHWVRGENGKRFKDARILALFAQIYQVTDYCQVKTLRDYSQVDMLGTRHKSLNFTKVDILHCDLKTSTILSTNI